MNIPLSVAVAIVHDDDKVLLIRRERGDYTGLWALPGGKIEQDEHVDEAASREIQEEAGIETTFDAYEGIVSEHLKDDEGLSNHFILHICRLTPDDTTIETRDEGETRWMSIDDIEEQQDTIIPSDYRILKELVDDTFSGYYQCIIEESGEQQELQRFEPI